MGVEINVVAPLSATPADLARLADAQFNVVLYPEIANLSAQWLQRQFGQAFTKTIPIGTTATRNFVREVAQLAGLDPEVALSKAESRAAWYARSVDSTYLTNKRVFVFGDATHAVAAAKVAAEEMGFTVVGIGTYSREFAREVREAAKLYGVEALISDDYLEIEARIAELNPELVLGTQMERHIAKRLGVPCAVISAPVHVQDFPARYSPQMGFEGANVLFDTWVHPLMMGLEEHLIGMFRGDSEFHEDAAPSHLGGGVHVQTAQAASAVATVVSTSTSASASASASTPVPEQINAPALNQGASQTNASILIAAWDAGAEKELKKIPFFVRGKARRNTEKYAIERGVTLITTETLYESKAYYSQS
jgi:light-independent protochlorophyllide reductase subunit B